MRFIKFLLIIICCLPIDSSAADRAEDRAKSFSPLRWDATEKTVLTAIVAANVIDCWQTHILTVRHHECYEEINPLTRSLFGCRVAWWESAVMKAAILGPVVYGIHRLVKSHRTRKIVLACVMMVAMEPVIRNEGVGGGVVFKF